MVKLLKCILLNVWSSTSYPTQLSIFNRTSTAATIQNIQILFEMFDTAFSSAGNRKLYLDIESPIYAASQFSKVLSVKFDE